MKQLLLILLFTTTANAQFIKEDYTQISGYIDPTFTDAGFQSGLEIQKIMHWGYASAAYSTYHGFDVGYSDLIGTLGLNFNLFNYKPVRYYSGFRLGFIRRNSPIYGSSSYPMVGGVIGFDFCVSKPSAEVKLHFGIRLWTDYREDQKNEFYGDSDGYERGLITNNPLLQENGAGVISISFN